MFDGLTPLQRKQALLIVVVASLGYFVDIFDLLLFAMVRIKSLTELGVAPEAMLEEGGKLLSYQMIGLLAGGIFWGILGDKRGRLSVLFGSILTYSIANLFNAHVTTIPQYEFWRFVAGFGLAGELGAGITLVAEVLPQRSRGIGTSLVAGIGILGAVVGYEVSSHVTWQMAYVVGGCLGLVLLILRLGVAESGLFQKLKKDSKRRGDFMLLFRQPSRLRKYLAIICLGMPLWYMVGILVTFSPEFVKDAGVSWAANPAKAIAACYLGLALGDLCSGLVSQWLQSRKRAVAAYMALQLIAIAAYFGLGLGSEGAFYPACFLMGLSGGYWALFVTIAAEQFGTDIRATVTTTVPNFVRGSVSLMVSGFIFFKAQQLSVAGSGLAVGAIVFLLGFWGLGLVEETYHKDLDYLEGQPPKAKTAVRKRATTTKASPRRLSARR
jgi:MFS transporter, putative metabolite:H+ symporter